MIKQASLSAYRAYTRTTARNITVPIEGVVVGVYFPRDRGNVSKYQIEYDVQPSHLPNMGILRNVPFAGGMHGIEDDTEVVLKPASLVVPIGVYNTNTHGPANDTDGDRVIVQFINGNVSNPVITHCMPHTQRTNNSPLMTPRYAQKLEALAKGPANIPENRFGTGLPGSTAANMTPIAGERIVHHRMHGTHVAEDRNGDIFIDFEAHPDPTKALPKGAVRKKIVIQNEGQDLLRIEKTITGKVNFVIAESFVQQLLVQVGDGAKSAALAEPLKDLWNNMKALYDLHSHPTGVGISGAPIASGQAWDDSIVSTKVKFPAG